SLLKNTGFHSKFAVDLHDSITSVIVVADTA
ncbi:MAG: hypothetical protein ACJAVW_001866, partial [Spirosomataceae bacterium]